MVALVGQPIIDAGPADRRRPWARAAPPPVTQEAPMNDDEMAARIREVYAIDDMEAFAKAQYEMSADDLVNEFPQ